MVQRYVEIFALEQGWHNNMVWLVMNTELEVNGAIERTQAYLNKFGNQFKFNDFLTVDIFRIDV